MNLQNKVLRGYIFLIVLISFMVSIVVHERQRISEISFQNDELQDIRRYINIAHQSITTLSSRPLKYPFPANSQYING